MYVLKYVKIRLTFQYRGGVTVDGRGISSAGGLPTYKQPPKQAVSSKEYVWYIIRFIANTVLFQIHCMCTVLSGSYKQGYFKSLNSPNQLSNI